MSMFKRTALEMLRAPLQRRPSLTAMAGVGALAIGMVVAPAGTSPAAAAAPAPVAHYTFDTDPSSGSVPNEISGGAPAVVVNPGAAGSTAGVEGNAIVLSGGSAQSGAHVQLPREVLAGANDLTVSTRVRWSGTGGSWQRVFDLGSSAERSLFVTPSTDGGRLRTAATTAGAGSEVRITGSGPLPSTTWRTLTVVLNSAEDELITYLDGAAVDSASTTMTAQQLLTASATNAGYIGRSFYPDPLLSGDVDDFKVYHQALSTEQVRSLVVPGPVPAMVALKDDSVEVRTTVGTPPPLPRSLPATFSDAYDRQVKAEWESVPPSQYAQPGTFTVDGVAAGTPITGVVRVLREGQLTVDLGTNTGPFMGGAAGALYGLYDDNMPTDALVEGFGLRTVATKAQDGAQHPGSDALEVLESLARSSNGKVYVRTTDWYRGFPYQWPGNTPQERLEGYFTVMGKQLDQIAALLAQKPHLTDNVVVEPFNEPEGNMFGDGQWSYNGVSWLNNPTDFFAAWDRAHALISAKLPGVEIAGPGTSQLFNQVRGFMAHTKAAGTTPDIITWHELSDPATVRQSVNRFRGWEDELNAGTPRAGTHLPINVNEYAFNYHTSVPGQMIQWISAVEDMKIEAMIAFWNINGNLSDSAVGSDRGNGQWWLYNAYSAMTGHTVEVDPPQPDVSYTLQGVATLDEGQKLAKAIIGGKQGGAYVDFANVPAAVFGDKVRVTVEEIPWTGQLGESPEPRFVGEYTSTVTNGSVGLDFGNGGVPALKESSAYEITITPVGTGTTTSVPAVSFEQSYEAEDATYTGGGYSRNGPEGSPNNVAGFYTSGGFNVGGLRTGSDGRLNFTADVPQDGTYDLEVFSSTLNTFFRVEEQGPTNIFLTVDGAQEKELFLPLQYKWVVWEHTDTTVNLTAGRHTITLAARSLDGTKQTIGDAIIDRIVVSKPKTSTDVYEAEHAEPSGAQNQYTLTGDVSGAGGSEVGAGDELTFWVNADQAGEHTLTVDTANTGTGKVVVNGRDIGAATATPLHVYLRGGVNKVVITGTGLVVDRLLVAKTSGNLTTVDYEAEAAQLAGTATVVNASLASGGKGVDGVGGEPGNANTLTFQVQAQKAGAHALTIRFANPEQVPATHYNPNPMARYAWLSVNGGTDVEHIFVPTFHRNQFFEKTILVDLTAGTNTLRWRSQEPTNWDGQTYASDTWPNIGLDLRADTAPIFDKITVAPLNAAGGAEEPTPTTPTTSTTPGIPPSPTAPTTPSADQVAPRIATKVVKPLEVGTRVKFRATVRAPGVVPTGTVKIRVRGAGERRSYTRTLNVRGRTTIWLPKFTKTGEVRIRIVYTGTEAVQSKRKVITLKVVDRTRR